VTYLILEYSHDIFLVLEIILVALETQCSFTLVSSLTGWDPITPVNIIIATDGSVILGVGYHSWVVATEDEDIPLQGGGPYGGDLLIMQ
jgi:hypothetical protein